MGCLVMDVTFFVERLSRSEWVVFADPYDIPIKTFSTFDAADKYCLYLRTYPHEAIPFLSDL